MQEISRARWIASGVVALAPAIARPIGAAAPAVIRFGSSTADTMSEPYFGLAYGAFDRAGVKIDISTLGNGAVILQACAGGAVDVGVADVIQVANAVNAGIPIAIFATGAVYSSETPTTALFVANDGPIATAKDFEGRAIALNSLNSLSEIATREWLRQNGADATLVKFIELGGGAMLESIARGTVAGGLAGEPHFTEAKDRFRLFAEPYDVVAKAFPISLFFARRDWLRANPAVRRRLTAAIYETARWSNAHPERTAPIVQKIAKLDAVLVHRMTRARFGTSLDPAAMQPELDIAVRYKALKQPIAAVDLVAAGP
jgi:NitT/TauT family transport system substrate-binding protein